MRAGHTNVQERGGWVQECGGCRNPKNMVDLLDPNFDPHGLYTKRAINTLSSLADVQPTTSMAISPSQTPFQANKHQIKSETPYFDKYRPYFGWVNTDTIRDSFKHTTQWGTSGGTFCWKQQSPFSNVHFRNNTKNCSTSSCS